VVIAGLRASGREVGKVEGGVDEEDGAKAEDEVRDDDVEKTVGKAVAPGIRTGTPPEGRSRIA